jgi:hypothetical protein
MSIAEHNTTATRLDVANDAEYFARPELSRSQAEDFHRDPWLYFQRHVERALPSESSPSMDFGTAVHELALYGEFRTVRPVPPEIANLTGKGSRTALNEWKADNPADCYLKPDDGARVERCVAAMRDHQTAARLLFAGDGESEIAVGGTCPATARELRAKFDRIIETPDRVVIADIKTSTTVAPAKFAWKCHDFGYARQAAWYSELAQQLTGKPATFYIIAVETGTLPRVEVYEIDPDNMIVARDELFGPNGILDRLDYAHRNDDWRPADYGEPKLLTLPTPQAYTVEQ